MRPKRATTNAESTRSAALTRRRLLTMTGAAAAVTASGCDLFATDPDGESESGAGAGAAEKGAEAPMLAELVEAGELPPVEERIPEQPLVVEPLESIGVYGGDWNATMRGPDDVAWLLRTTGYECLMRWDLAFEDVFPNVAADLTPEDEGRAYVVTLRAGMRWSDGEPFTADDIVFAYEEVLSNEQLYPEGVPSVYQVGDEPAQVEKVDDHTVRFTFAAPNGLFPQNLATPEGRDLTRFPRHYLEQFHADHNDDIDQLVEEAGAADWIELFEDHADEWNPVELPRLYPWVPETTFGEGDRIVWVRNPYYWKVDPDGSQLPYLDRFVNDIVEDPEVMVLRAAQGDIDFQDRSLNAPANKPVLAEAREEGNFRFIDEPPTNSVTIAIALNLTHENPVKREVYQNKDFRIGLSYAINRQEIIEAVYQRQGEPYQVAPRPDSPFYDEEMAKQYTEYDVDLANEHLDRAGLTEHDGDGFRLGPDGERITIGVATADGDDSDPLELIESYWADVGIHMQIQTPARGLFQERRDGNQADATVWGAEGAGRLEPLLRTDWWFPSAYESNNYAPLWYEWYQTDGASGEEPPELAQEQMDLYEQVRQAIDEEERDALMSELLQLGKEYFYHIGVSLAPDWYGIVKNNFHNVPQEMPASFFYPSPAPANPEQFYKSDDN